jgi:hypothetical protein
MDVDEQQLFGILRIARDTSFRGEGISMKEALKRSSFDELRNAFGPQDLVPMLSVNPELMQDWLRFCQDKRTRGGCCVFENSFEVGVLGSSEFTVRFDSLEAAVADFVVCELDYWSAVGRGENPVLRK